MRVIGEVQHYYKTSIMNPTYSYSVTQILAERYSTAIMTTRQITMTHWMFNLIILVVTAPRSVDYRFSGICNRAQSLLTSMFIGPCRCKETRRYERVIWSIKPNAISMYMNMCILGLTLKLCSIRWVTLKILVHALQCCCIRWVTVKVLLFTLQWRSIRWLTLKISVIHYSVCIRRVTVKTLILT